LYYFFVFLLLQALRGASDKSVLPDTGQSSKATRTEPSLSNTLSAHRTKWIAVGRLLRWGARHGAVRSLRETKGVLTINIVGAERLDAQDISCDPYATLTVHDPARVKPMKNVSSVFYRDRNPRWDEQFEFAGISATSILVIELFDKTTLAEGTKSILKLKFKKAFTDVALGHISIPVEEVVKNGRIGDTWALQVRAKISTFDQPREGFRRKNKS